MLLLLIVILQQPFQIRSLIKYLPCKLRVGDNSPFPIVLQGTGSDIQPFAHFLACQEMLISEEWLVCLRHFLYPSTYTADSGQHHLHVVSLHVQISYLFPSSLALFVVLGFVCV